MTPAQEMKIKQAWAKLRSTRERVSRSAEALKSAGLAGASAERLGELDQQHQDAIDADSAALDDVEKAMRAAGINV
jgi:hypothetical protein